MKYFFFFVLNLCFISSAVSMPIIKDMEKNLEGIKKIYITSEILCDDNDFDTDYFRLKLENQLQENNIQYEMISLFDHDKLKSGDIYLFIEYTIFPSPEQFPRLITMRFMIFQHHIYKGDAAILLYYNTIRKPVWSNSNTGETTMKVCDIMLETFINDYKSANTLDNEKDEEQAKKAGVGMWKDRKEKSESRWWLTFLLWLWDSKESNFFAALFASIVTIFLVEKIRDHKSTIANCKNGIIILESINEEMVRNLNLMSSCRDNLSNNTLPGGSLLTYAYSGENTFPIETTAIMNQYLNINAKGTDIGILRIILKNFYNVYCLNVNNRIDIIYKNGIDSVNGLLNSEELLELLTEKNYIAKTAHFLEVIYASKYLLKWIITVQTWTLGYHFKIYPRWYINRKLKKLKKLKKDGLLPSL